MTTTLASTIRAEIQTRFADGQPFSVLDFPKYPNAHGRSRCITNTLEALSRDTSSKPGFIRKIGKFESKMPGYPPCNRYQIASADIAIAQVEIADKPGNITIWHPVETPPHHIGDYDIKRVGSDKAERREWDGKGFGTLPTAYIGFWRGVPR